ncbi:MAG: hypothetical protein IKF90_12455 [Parasporobacterium sp.]|nr:hypothetical protein [Parasporobacterium sp.]
MKHYSIHETRSTFIDELCASTRAVRVSVRDDYYGTYDYEESFISMEQYLQKHSYSLDSFLDRY